MSVRALTWAFDQPIFANEKVVLLSLADHANDCGECWPSINRLAQRARVSVRTVQRCLAELEDAKLIIRETRNDLNGRSTSNMYRLCMSEQVRMPAEASGGQRKEEGVNLAPCDDDAGDRGEGVKGDGVEGVNNVTLIRTVIKNPQKETSSISSNPEFEEFWAAYPKRPNNPRKKAMASYLKARKNVSQKQLLEAVGLYAAYMTGENPKFVAMASTWLNDERWNCDYSKTAKVIQSYNDVKYSSDDEIDAIIAKYPGVVSDRMAAKRALSGELAKGVALDDIVKAAEKFKLYIKQMKNLGTMVAPPILEVWIKFKWREMDAYYIYRNPVERYPVLKPVKVK